MERIIAFIMSLMIIMCLTGCGEESNVKSIEEEINYISNMDNSDEKMVKIMNLEKEIKKLSTEEKNNIKYLELFYDEAINTSIELKENVSWSECLNKEVNYLTLNDFINIENINKMRLIKNFVSTFIFIEKKEIINDIVNLIDIPYINVLNNDVDISDQLTSNSAEFYSYELFIDDNYCMSFYAYSNGYVWLSAKVNNIDNAYVSIVKIDFDKLKDICSFENLRKK